MNDDDVTPYAEKYQRFEYDWIKKKLAKLQELLNKHGNWRALEAERLKKKEAL